LLEAGPPIEPAPRRSAQFENKLAALGADDRLIIELAEEATFSDPTGEHARRTLDDGTVVDLGSYDGLGVILTFVRDASGQLIADDFFIDRRQ
jgi:hypothetical protein